MKFVVLGYDAVHIAQRYRFILDDEIDDIVVCLLRDDNTLDTRRRFLADSGFEDVRVGLESVRGDHYFLDGRFLERGMVDSIARRLPYPASTYVSDLGDDDFSVRDLRARGFTIVTSAGIEKRAKRVRSGLD